MAIALNELPARLQNGSGRLIFISDQGTETLRTFGDLYSDAATLAQSLRRVGINAGCRIGLFAPNSYSWMVWDLAALMLRCVTVAFPQEKGGEPIERLVDRYALHLIAVDPAWVAADALASEYVVPMEAISLPQDKAAVERTPLGHAPETYSLVFSSGTTGKTKGLLISRPGTERLLNLYGQAFGVAPGERFLTFLPFANYQQRMAYYFCLHHGIDFVYTPFPQLFATLKKHKPTYVIAPPVFYESLHNLAQTALPARKEPRTGLNGETQSAASGGDAASSARRLANLLGGNIRYLITGMAPIKRQTLDFFWNNGVPLYEAFGITEAGMVCWNKPGRVKIGTVGQPAEPDSVTLTREGEVVVTRDALLSLGYFEASEDDARGTFIGEGSVATGDIAEFDDDGFLTIIGRKKDAIITKSGEKFHPEPIESLIQRHPAVKVAVVMASDGMPGTSAVVVVQSVNDKTIEGDIRREIERMNLKLPVYQQVKKVLFTQEDLSIENGMRTRNMKLNRKAIHKKFLAPMEAGPAVPAACEVVA